MSNTRKQQPEKISADCPHCGYSQLESAYAKSTICKRCSQHFSIEKLLAKEVGSLKPPSVFEKLTKLIKREGVREIVCFSCGARQELSTAAESSLCPKCGSYIDLRDFRISGPFGRTVQTQGRVTILPKGDVTTRILCGEGRIEGKMRGVMMSSGTIEIRLDGRLLGQVDAERVVIERKSNLELAKPLRGRAIEVNGKVTGEIVCEGCVTINDHGMVTGTIYARAINVEKGGILNGELHIGAPPAAEEEVVAEAVEAVEDAPAEAEPESVEEAPAAEAEMPPEEPVAEAPAETPPEPAPGPRAKPSLANRPAGKPRKYASR